MINFLLRSIEILVLHPFHKYFQICRSRTNIQFSAVNVSIKKPQKKAPTTALRAAPVKLTKPVVTPIPAAPTDCRVAI